MQLFFVLRAFLSFSFIVINTLFWFVPVLFFAVLKKLFIFPGGKAFINRILDGIATIWIEINNINQRILGHSIITLSGEHNLPKREWYMLVANHQSWVDILVLQRLFNRNIPFIKFFLKQELIWVPFVGIAWWALEFPFMKRYSQSTLDKHPELKGQDIEITRKACEKYQHFPVSIMNFLEGTRFSAEKFAQQESSFQHLLKPKAGGLSFALTAMGGKLHKLIDVTIVYPSGVPSFFEYLSGKVREIKVHVRVLPIPDNLLGDYQNDGEYRHHFQGWVNDLWLEKDQRFDLMLKKERSAPQNDSL